ncbi:MAG: penicillin acylase family protein, partial [Gemmatimonadetes bacterium]|nr:penicillin acylase family protein [Gemmatimonadota bacterium]
MRPPQVPRFDRSPVSPARVTTLLLLALAPACAEAPGTSFEDLAEAHLPQIEGSIQVPGLQAEVEVLRDPWGVPHIYASNLDDLFFAQGFVQAQDRLWQMEMYRRAGEGRLAEVLGPGALQHDRVARLLKFRGPFDDEEYTSYHPEGRRILEAFASGINAYIDHAMAAGELPVEFLLTGIEPEPWVSETPLLRMQTAMPLGDVRRELRLAERVAELGADEANRQANPTPWRELEVPGGVDLSLISDDVLAGVTGFRNAMSSPPLVPPYDGWTGSEMALNLGARETSPGSNNWAIHGSRTESGHAIVANDPHRGVTNPSLRYVVHLDAPGWTAIGSTEPVLPGVAIGHNGRIAWGLTIVGTDQSDVYVEQVNPENPKQVRWGDGWEEVRTITETVQVKDGEPVTMELEFSRHGPIFHRDPDNNLAYAMRSTMHEPGTTGYLSGLRLNVVSDCAGFVDELRYWLAPTENMICGDADGNIAWQAAALSPSRPNWHGRLPVPGTGEYEWDEFRADLPTEFNPERGWVGTANHDIHPPGYDP